MMIVAKMVLHFPVVFLPMRVLDKSIDLYTLLLSTFGGVN